MNKYKVIYGYCHPNAWLSHNACSKICNTFDEAKKFINSLPKMEYRMGYHDCEYRRDELGFIYPGREPSNLYAKIKCEGKDFWIEGNPNDVWFKKELIGSNNPTRA